MPLFEHITNIDGIVETKNMELNEASTAIKSSFPSLLKEGLHPLGGHTTWTFATLEHVFRFARTKEVAPLLENEKKNSAKLAGKLPVKIPHSIIIREWSSLPCSSYPIIHGDALNPRLFFGAYGTSIAQQIGELLTSFHTAESIRPTNKQDFKVNVDTTDKETFSRLPLPMRFAAGYALRKATTLLKAERPSLVHGNFKFQHLHMKNNQLVGLTGLSKARIGDIAQDFSSIFAEVGWKGIDDVLRFYKRPLGGEFEERVKFFYWTAPLYDINYAIQAKNEPAIGLARTEISKRMTKTGVLPSN